MKPAKSDPRSRIFVGQGHLHQDIPEALLQQVEAFLKTYPSAYAMLEFTSPGPDHRQVDCALVSPGGIDVIEVKRHWGVITVSPDGLWRTSDGRAISNTKRGRSENPYQQAYNTAQDLQKGVNKLFAAQIRVTPLVFLPNARRLDNRAERDRDFNAELALGNEPRAFRGALRSASKNHGGGWDGADHWELPARLGLQPMNLAFVQGRVISGLDGKGVPEVKVWIEAQGQQLQTLTSPAGVYEFAAGLGSEVQIGFVAPERFQLPDPLLVQASQPFLSMGDTALPERYPRRTEEEIYAEVMQQLEAHTEAQVRQAQVAWDDTQFQMGVVIDDLNSQLREALMQLAERERTLAASLKAAAQTPLPLPVQVRQQADLQVAVAQRAEVSGALERLQVSVNTEQQDAVRQAIVALTRVVTSQRLELERPREALLPVRAVKATPRFLAPLPEEDPEDDHTEAREATSEVSADQAAPSSQAAAPPPPQAAPRAAPSRLPVAALGLALVLGAGGTAWWMAGKGERPVNTPVPAALEAAPAPQVAQDEAPPADEAFTNLPGEVVTETELPVGEVISDFENLPGVPAE